MAYKYLNVNPKHQNTGDCVIRGISVLMNQSWAWTYFMICLQGFLMYEMPSTNSVWSTYLSNCGYTRTGMEPYAEEHYPSYGYGRTRYDMGYSGHSTKDRMIAALEDTMGEAKNEYEMNMIRETINRIQSGN